jgi:hypothetical protein
MSTSTATIITGTVEGLGEVELAIEDGLLAEQLSDLLVGQGVPRREAEARAEDEAYRLLTESGVDVDYCESCGGAFPAQHITTVEIEAPSFTSQGDSVDLCWGCYDPHGGY